VPAEDQIWQDPVPKPHHPLIDEKDAADLKAKLLQSGAFDLRARLPRVEIRLHLPFVG
jgi:catalase (peroxidase I)